MFFFACPKGRKGSQKVEPHQVFSDPLVIHEWAKGQKIWAHSVVYNPETLCLSAQRRKREK